MVARYDLDDRRLPEFHNRTRDALKDLMELKLGGPIKKIMRLRKTCEPHLVMNVKDPLAERPGLVRLENSSAYHA